MINRIKDPTKKAINTSRILTSKEARMKLIQRMKETKIEKEMWRERVGTKPNGFTKVDQYIE